MRKAWTTFRRGQAAVERVLNAAYPFPEYTSDSLGFALSAEVDYRLSASSPSTSTFPLFAGGAKNAQCWLDGIDYSGWGTGIPGGALITPQHAIGVSHAPAPVGATVTYLGSLGKAYTRTVSFVAGDPGADLSIATLSAPLPTDVFPFSVFNPYLLGYAPGMLTVAPCIWFNQNTGDAAVSNVSNLPLATTFSSTGTASFSPFSFASNDPRNTRTGWSETVSGGASGSPVFLLFKKVLVLVSTVASNLLAGAFSGAFISQALDWINSVISPYEVSVITPDDFPKYAAYA